MTDCNNPKYGKFNSMDRLSDLPEFIIHHIISYLDMEEAYRTSVLSKRWNQIFATNPILDFYHYKFPQEMLPRLLEYIDTRMQNFSKENLRITKFRLDLPPTNLLLACKVDEWLEIAVRNQVAKIELERFANYKLPRILFCAKSLKHLDIANVEIPYYEAVDLVSLEVLGLRDVVVEERMLFHIVSSCLLLKDLTLSNCVGYKNIVIPRRSKLEYLYIDGDVPEDGRVFLDLETSTLMSFKYNINNETPWPIISKRGLLRNLRILLLPDLCMTGDAFAELILPELTSLEKLVIIGWQMLTSFKISHTQLKHICLSDCHNLLNVVIDAPCLKKFKFNGEVNPPLSITIHSQANCTIDFNSSASYFDSDGFFILKKLLKGLNSCNVLKLWLFDKSPEPTEDDEIKFDEEESGNADLGPPCDIEELKLDLYSYSKPSSSSLSAFLNGLFWTCRPSIISLRFDPGCGRKLTVEPLVNKLVDMVKCSSHPLKRIEVGETTTCPDSHKPTTPNNALDVQLRLCW